MQKGALGIPGAPLFISISLKELITRKMSGLLWHRFHHNPF